LNQIGIHEDRLVSCPNVLSMPSILPAEFILSLSVVVVALHEDRLVSCPNALSTPSILPAELFLSLSIVVVPLHDVHDITVGQ
jgi:hypothetical protein